MNYKPTGYPDLSPYLLVADVERVIAVLTEAMDGERLRVFPADDGTTSHAEVSVFGTVVMLGQMADPPDCHVHVYVPDVDAAFARVVRAGATVIQEPMEKDDGDRRSGVRLPGGSCWWFGTQVLGGADADAD